MEGDNRVMGGAEMPEGWGWQKCLGCARWGSAEWVEDHDCPRADAIEAMKARDINPRPMPKRDPNRFKSPCPVCSQLTGNQTNHVCEPHGTASPPLAAPHWED